MSSMFFSSFSWDCCRGYLNRLFSGDSNRDSLWLDSFKFVKDLYSSVLVGNPVNIVVSVSIKVHYYVGESCNSHLRSIFLEFSIFDINVKK